MKRIIPVILLGLLAACAPDKPKAENESSEDINGTELKPLMQ